MTRTKSITKVFMMLSLAIIFALASVGQAKAATSTFNFDTTFSGQTPGGTTPYLTATIDDSYDGPEKVLMTIDASGLDTMESITKLYFNFYDGTASSDASLLSFTWGDTDDIDTSKANNAMEGGNNAYQADGDGKYDFWIDLPPPGGSFDDRLTAGEQISLIIEYDSAIDINSFNYMSVEGGGNGSYFAAAHIQNIGNNGMGEEGSGWVGASVVPEPVSSTLFIVGAAALGFRRFRKK